MLPSPGLHLTEKQTVLLAGGVALFSTMSLISSLIIIFTHWYWPQLRMKSLKLVAFMSVALAGADLTALIFITGGDCGWYTFLTNFFVISTALWSVVLSRNLSLVLNRDGLSTHFSRLNSITRSRGGCCFKWLRQNVEGIRMFVFHSFCWGLAFLCAVAIDVGTDEEPSLSNWCWFSVTNAQHNDDPTIDTIDDTDNTYVGTTPPYFQLLLFFIPIGFSMLYNMKTLFWASFRNIIITNCTERGRDTALMNLAETNENELQQSINVFTTHFRYYIGLSFIVSLWLFVAEFINIYDISRHNIIWSYCVLLIVFRLHGFGNLCIYLFRDDVRDAWWKEIYGWFGWTYIRPQRNYAAAAAIGTGQQRHSQMSDPGENSSQSHRSSHSQAPSAFAVASAMRSPPPHPATAANPRVAAKTAIFCLT